MFCFKPESRGPSWLFFLPLRMYFESGSIVGEYRIMNAFRNRNRNRGIAGLLAVVFALTSLWVPAAQAGMVSTAELVEEQTVAEQRAAIQAALAREDVRRQLVELGVDPSRVDARVASLTDSQVRELHGRMGELPAAGDSLIGALVFVFIVLLITDLLGLTDVFPFVTGKVEVED